MLKNYKELKVWQKSYQFCLEIYKNTKRFPGEERYGLTSPIRRSAVSVPSNIADKITGEQTLDPLTPRYRNVIAVEDGDD